MTLIAAQLKNTSKHFDKNNLNRTLVVRERIFFLITDNADITSWSNLHVPHDDIEFIYVIGRDKEKSPKIKKVTVDIFLRKYHDCK